MTKLIIKRWKEDGIEKVGFYDHEGKFHMLFGLAKDWERDVIRVLDLKTGDWTKFKLQEEDINELTHIPWD